MTPQTLTRAPRFDLTGHLTAAEVFIFLAQLPDFVFQIGGGDLLAIALDRAGTLKVLSFPHADTVIGQ